MRALTLFNMVTELNYSLNSHVAQNNSKVDPYYFFNPQNLPLLVKIAYTLHPLVTNTMIELIGDKKGVDGNLYRYFFCDDILPRLTNSVARFERQFSEYLNVMPLKQDDFADVLIQIAQGVLGSKKNFINAYIKKATRSISGRYTYPATFDRYNLAKNYCKQAIKNRSFELIGAPKLSVGNNIGDGIIEDLIKKGGKVPLKVIAGLTGAALLVFGFMLE
jgi:hypothetical protein